MVNVYIELVLNRLSRTNIAAATASSMTIELCQFHENFLKAKFM